MFRQERQDDEIGERPGIHKDAARRPEATLPIR